MISTVYIASEIHRLDFELRIVRHFLLDRSSRAVRDAFIAIEGKRYLAGIPRYLEQDRDQSIMDDRIGVALSKGYQRWLDSNFEHLIEFSENRLKQMEIILRYALFESLFLKTVGNILWENPRLLDLPIHVKLLQGDRQQDQLKKHRKRLQENPLSERISKTLTLVSTIDRLPFARWKEERPYGGLYVWQYLQRAFNLEFGQEKMCEPLEWTRQIRNYLVHSSLRVTVLNDRLAEAETCLAAFPFLFVRAASKRFPNACSEEPSGEGEDGTPDYVSAEVFF